LLAAATLVLLLPSGRAQDTAGEKVKFMSVDGVHLHGTFYASDKRQKAPAVMVIHAIGESSRSKEYADLASKLQKEGFSVLTFDLRGHGQSTNIDPSEFWLPKYPNRNYVQGATQRKDTIELRDINPGYYSVFVNDIAAAKAYLDKRNDDKECNSSNLILIGAGSGATLGAIWMNSEWYRFKVNPSPTGIGTGTLEKTPEGKNIICGFWLSITPDLGSRKVSLSGELYEAGKVKKVPMVFVYNSDEPKDKSTATGLVKAIKGKDKKTYPFTDATPVQAGSKLTGRQLLKTMGPDQISEYLKNVQSENANEWQEQDSRKSQYMWKAPLRPPQWAKQMSVDSAIRFSTYSEFIR
jgi:Serine aminopeptidase, S33